MGLLATLVLVWSAFRYRMPLMHAGAIASISLVALVGYHTAVGHLLSLSRAELPAEMLRLVTSAPSANVLAAVFVSMAFVAELLARRGLRRHGVVYLGGCAVLAAVGLSLVTWHGFAGGDDTLRAAILFGLYASVCLGLAARWRNTIFADAGVWLAAASMLWAAWWADLPLAGAFLTHASVAGLALLAITLRVARPEQSEGRGWLAELFEGHLLHALRFAQGVPHELGRVHVRDTSRDVFSRPLLLGAFCSSILAVPALVIMPPQTILAAAGFVSWIAGVWMLIGVLVQRATIVAAAQAALSLAVILASTAWIEQQNLTFNNPLYWQAYLFPLAALGLAWAGIRIALRQVPAADRMLNPGWVPAGCCRTVCSDIMSIRGSRMVAGRCLWRRIFRLGTYSRTRARRDFSKSRHGAHSRFLRLRSLANRGRAGRLGLGLALEPLA